MTEAMRCVSFENCPSRSQKKSLNSASSMAASWDYGIVAFLDILGFASFVEADATGTTPEHLERLLGALDRARNSSAASSTDVRVFSDSIVLSAEFGNAAVVPLI